MVKVFGTLTGRGQVLAERLQLAPDSDRAMQRVIFDGLLVGEVPGTSFDVLIQHVLRGKAQVDRALANDPDRIVAMQFHAGTQFFDAQGRPLTLQDLEIGQRVRARFDTFVSEPFIADEIIVMRSTPSGAAVITDVAGVPRDMTVHYAADSAAVLAGQIESSLTDVSVDLTQASIELEGLSPRPMRADQLSAGMHLRIYGSVAGTPQAPTVAPSLVVVRSGRFEGCITRIDPGNSAIEVQVSRHITSPGGRELPSYQVNLVAGTNYRGGRLE